MAQLKKKSTHTRKAAMKRTTKSSSRKSVSKKQSKGIFNIKAFAKLNKAIALAVVAVVVVVGYFVLNSSAAIDGAHLYLSPNNSTFAAGENVTMEVRLNTDGKNINAVQADLSYPQDMLEFVSVDAASSAFPIEAQLTGGNGSVKIARGNIAGVTGDVLVAKVTFKTITSSAKGKKAGTAAKVVFSSTSTAVESEDNTDALEGTEEGVVNIGSTTTGGNGGRPKKN
jgi:hypothetical protein